MRNPDASLLGQLILVSKLLELFHGRSCQPLVFVLGGT